MTPEELKAATERARKVLNGATAGTRTMEALPLAEDFLALKAERDRLEALVGELELEAGALGDPVGR